MAFVHKLDAVRVKMNQNQEFLRDIDTMIRTRGSNPIEVQRLQAARVDVCSRLTPEEISQYEATRNVVKEISPEQMAADIKAMEENRDSNSI